MLEVREDPDVSAAADDAFEKWTKAEEAWRAIHWVLSHDPTKGMPLTEGGRARSFVYEGSWAHDMPTIQVVYEVSLHWITILEVRFVAPASSGGNA